MAKTTIREMLSRQLQIVVRGFDTVDHVLRRGGPRCSSSSGVESKSKSFSKALPLRQVLAIVLVCGAIYGAAMGSYALVVGERTFVAQIPQIVYSAIKVPLLICFTVAISLPSFFVINTLLGLREDFPQALRAIVSAQAGLSLILVSLFPITLLIYFSLPTHSSSYPIAILFNAAMFAVASISAQLLLSAYYRELVQRSRRHRWMVRMWIFVYAFVGIQAGYVFRPFIGSPTTEPSFLRKDSFQNAYVEVYSLICEVLKNSLVCLECI